MSVVEVLRDVIDHSIPQHSSACAAQDEEAACICGTEAVMDRAYAALDAAPAAGKEPTIGDMQRALAKAMGCPLDDTYPQCSHAGDAWEYARHLIRDGLVITSLQDSHEAELGKPRDAVAEGHQDARELDWDTRAQEQKDYTPGPSELVDYGD